MTVVRVVTGGAVPVMPVPLEEGYTGPVVVGTPGVEVLLPGQTVVPEVTTMVVVSLPVQSQDVVVVAEPLELVLKLSVGVHWSAGRVELPESA